MLTVRTLGMVPYEQTWQDMQQFTAARTDTTADELWLLEHPPVYTQGQAGKPEHVLNPGGIPIIQTDRGGQVTYHGPGQLVAYVLMDIRRRKLGIRTLVCRLEEVILKVLDDYGITGETRCKAPGVYVGEKKIASIGLRVKNGCTYHGIALNVSTELSPFNGINPCGFERLEMTRISDFTDSASWQSVAIAFQTAFVSQFGCE
ncbi:lipoyltransferase [Legionella geestiana]|uniref:Octanoyltransferase n=1 Tax=Legionella geestiana TaxID=45065 RepID=A0A0W0U8K5_9GAMM|nr:lipoyl(octanoyl) transferase LipB [Legionella geestiana]KTD04224.1 lipoyltransferase [Legionella geestiana]STX53671.1 lipoyl(octanoyl) transferase [Legionella geestiana]